MPNIRARKNFNGYLGAKNGELTMAILRTKIDTARAYDGEFANKI